MIFSTQRLMIRRWRGSDVDALVAVYGDEKAMRWVATGEALRRADCMDWLRVTRTNYERRGYGMFAVERRSQPGVIGFCGLVHPGGQRDAEAKYAYHRCHWGFGFATEALVGLLNYASTAHDLKLVIATAAAENIASHKVLLKAGMRLDTQHVNVDGSSSQRFVWTP